MTCSRTDNRIIQATILRYYENISKYNLETVIDKLMKSKMQMPQNV